MRHSFTAVLSRNERFTGDFETEPYEVGWATEARLFVHVLELTGAGATPGWDLAVQISPDGLFWCDLDAPSLTIDGPGLFTYSFREFGNWVRIRATAHAADAMVRPIIYLALKE
ncbi:MAG: hypothetical protein EA384_07855 [Spirochaetaceae bacterium]|nr:MAG: hypothetical protein EA384_07855 [Spirochaetaceae bacterium]